MKGHDGQKEAGQAAGEEVCFCCSSLVGRPGSLVIN